MVVGGRPHVFMSENSSTSDDYVTRHNPNAQLALYSQEVNPASYTICTLFAYAQQHIFACGRR